MNHWGSAGRWQWWADVAARCWRMRRWLVGTALSLPLLPLGLGQGWIGESSFVLAKFARPVDGLSYFFPIINDRSRVLFGLPYALALLTPWPEWVMAVLVVGCWLLLAAITYAIAARLRPDDHITAVLAT